ncbi:hypothetical protein GCM10008957_25890 [Deinococcus ruber]|uniref:Uncharacterized protein n=1 Tax=Deinococcus ruber TaxID=1848197 RepID=A0A918C9L4_9DEIO|nr:hypothetical protein GCM10008957_25890 [Deinococcus ruber]
MLRECEKDRAVYGKKNPLTLHRVNLRGEFNIPIGKKRRAIVPKGNSEDISSVFESIDIISDEFGNLINKSSKAILFFYRYII